jgi:hypothetical protein
MSGAPVQIAAIYGPACYSWNKTGPRLARRDRRVIRSPKTPSASATLARVRRDYLNRTVPRPAGARCQKHTQRIE